MGVYLVRGENVAIVGEVDPVLDATNPLLQAAPWEEVRDLEAAEEAEDRAKVQAKLKAAGGGGGGAGGGAGGGGAAAAGAGVAAAAEGHVRGGWAME